MLFGALVTARSVIVTDEPTASLDPGNHVAILAVNGFLTGPVESVMTSDGLSRLYRVGLVAETTPSGRFVVGPA